MAPNIPAIETIYQGNRFRSRTEAKWAVFFDLVGIPYEFEPQGVELPSGKYLPDFWLPTQNLWVEVKGAWDAIGSLGKYGELCAISSHPVVIAVGQPDATNQMLLIWPNSRTSAGVAFTAQLGDDLAAHLVIREGRFNKNGRDLAFSFPAPRYVADVDEFMVAFTDAPHAWSVCDDELRRAGYARFEHGECGAPA